MNSVSQFCDLCRLCASKTNALSRIYIFETEGKQNDVVSKITSCLCLKIAENDSLPKIVCNDCVEQVESYYNFKMKTNKCEALFYDILSKDTEKQSELQNCENNDYFSKLNLKRIEKNNAEGVAKIKTENIVCEPSLVVQEKAKKSTNLEPTPPKPKPGQKQKMLIIPTLRRLLTSKKNVEPPEVTKKISPIITFMGGMVKSQNSKEETLDEEPIKRLRSKTIMKPVPPKPTNLPKLTDEASTVFQCHYCKVPFTSREAAMNHIRKEHKQKQVAPTTHEVGPLQCSIIPRETKDRSVVCNDCGKVYKRVSDLRLHQRKHTGEKPYSCTYCEKRFASSSSRNQHIQVHEQRWSHVCNFCGKGFINKVQFTYHVRKHTGERPFECEKCDKNFLRKTDLQQHEISSHSDEPRQLYKCEVCLRSYSSSNYLNKHKLTHSVPLEARKKFKCNICDSLFISKSRLKHHILVHTGEMPFECEICKKRYNNKEGLKIHLLIHSGVKQFVCDICGKEFAQRNTLVCHRRIHTGERPYKCDICQQQFTQKSSLNCHRKRHTRDQTLQN